MATTRSEPYKTFYDVTLDRIADPAVPIGCLIAQSVTQVPLLSPESRRHVQAILDVQRTRVRQALGPPLPASVYDEAAASTSYEMCRDVPDYVAK